MKSDQSIWIGTATDPYQPAERRYRITRSILEVFGEERGFRLGLTTKSDLVVRDADLLASVGRANSVRVNLTVTTLDETLARALEPMAPRPALRIQAIGTLVRAGIRVAVLAHPVMPLINDSEASLNAVCQAAADAGATSFSAAPLFLKDCSAKVFLPFLEEQFPHLARRYRERYQDSAYLKGHYPEMLRERVREIRARHGMESQESDPVPDERENQLRLF